MIAPPAEGYHQPGFACSPPCRSAVGSAEVKLLKWLIAAGADVAAADQDDTPLLRLVWDGLLKDVRCATVSCTQGCHPSAFAAVTRLHSGRVGRPCVIKLACHDCWQASE